LRLQRVDVAAPSYGANADISAAQGAAATIHGCSCRACSAWRSL